ncbi:MAG: M20/M25/M40 family metallo-hydrolase [Eubacterium sp.]|nr:M20/M25/M40 family metallo-hydrolase [Eubacterium sp.]
MYDDIRKTFAELVEIDSPSLGERRMAEHIKKMFTQLGIELTEDDSADITGSDTGNLYAYVPGTLPGKPILLAAHMDTVMPAHGKQAIFYPDGTVTSDGTTVLGADDLAAVTAIYEAIREIKENRIPHRDLELLFTTGEELYCKGAKAFDGVSLQSAYVYVPDLSGTIGTAAYAAPTLISFQATVNGVAAHAGFAPEAGINAIAAAADAIAALPQGRIDEETTANIGTITGGDGINIVSPKCIVKGEVRSLRHEKALEILDVYRQQFEKSSGQYGATLEWESEPDIQAYETSLESKAVMAFREAADKVGVEAVLEKTFGGSDNNVFARHGLEGLVIASAMHKAHTCEEYTNLHEIEQVAQILIHLLSDEENAFSDS